MAANENQGSGLTGSGVPGGSGLPGGSGIDGSGVGSGIGSGIPGGGGGGGRKKVCTKETVCRTRTVNDCNRPDLPTLPQSSCSAPYQF